MAPLCVELFVAFVFCFHLNWLKCIFGNISVFDCRDPAGSGFETSEAAVFHQRCVIFYFLYLETGGAELLCLELTACQNN